MKRNGTPNGPIEHGFPHLDTVRAAITALHRRLTTDGIRAYDTAFAPGDAAFGPDEDLHLGAHRVASAMVRALRLPDARVLVSFRPMEQAATVELTDGPEYFVEVADRFRTHRGDLAAALSHEVAHVLLHRLDLRFATTADNEILTDTAAAYLGAGWLLLDAYRQDALTHQKFGYLTPEEFGYVLAKRGRLIGEDLSARFTSPRAYEAYVRGGALDARDHRRAPLAAAGPAERLRYARARRSGAAAERGAGYRFEGHGAERRVSFPCPVCAQRLRLPVRGPLRARCALCGTVLECAT
ncbi:hypothetical protein [Streptomyces subrutilus]|uniref:Uncharacterized protein n=1 Tax=Streptomyces subrutilus TaxID=36818 RepID=A0A5P2US03_9ACTN|nr:hypothetical protein [Streptomyces subrutilus]QEU81065.1 hypothetical protein CP968_24700 [Streptomyces subrutilus]WSJ29623.1 hypothetical protein OG479_10050 [Streptomyces subrutilus]GGZ65996.1 hypothetical protein GCM10010371_27120 [Streptomyces subrutilus]